MPKQPLSFLSTLSTQPKKVFLLDGIGALLSFTFIVLLSLFHTFIGLPQATLFMLATTALVFAVYSLSCYFLLTGSWKPYLLVITSANTLYAVVTASLIIQYYQTLTIFGLTYFVLELIVLCILIALEVRILLSN